MIFLGRAVLAENTYTVGYAESDFDNYVWDVSLLLWEMLGALKLEVGEMFVCSVKDGEICYLRLTTERFWTLMVLLGFNSHKGFHQQLYACSLVRNIAL